MDVMPDQLEDDHQFLVPPEEIIMGGKYKKGDNIKDKNYVKWVRAKIKAQGSTVEMMRVRLYIEFRDNGKSNRLRHMDAQMTQGPIAPSRGRSSKDQPPQKCGIGLEQAEAAGLQDQDQEGSWTRGERDGSMPITIGKP